MVWKNTDILNYEKKSNKEKMTMKEKEQRGGQEEE